MSHIRGLLTPAEAVYRVLAKSLSVYRRRVSPTILQPRKYSVATPQAPTFFRRGRRDPSELIPPPDPFPEYTKNHDIDAQRVYLLNPNQSGLTDEPRDRKRLLRIMQDRKRLKEEGLDIWSADQGDSKRKDDDELFLIQVGNGPNKVPVCRIVERNVLILERLQKRKKQKETAKISRAKATKELEVNWAISENDLKVKLQQLEGFITQGKKVQVVLAGRRRSRKATVEEARNVLDKIREKVQEISAVESKPMEGSLLGNATLLIEKRS